MKHILRYGTNAEQKYIEQIKNSFDLLAFNGNMLAYTPGAIAGFIMMHILKSKRSKGYFIDPITHAFQHDISTISSYSEKEKKIKIKKSVENLIEAYGEPIQSNINSEISVLPSHFNTPELKLEFCKNVINFQLNTIITELEKKGFMDYINNAALDISKLKPCFLIAPYFYLTTKPTDFKWLPLNCEFIKLTKSIANDQEVYAQLVVSKEILTNESFRNEILDEYTKVKPSGVLLWIDKFDDHDANISELNSFVEIIKKFTQNEIPIYNLYGGFFSTILTGFKNELGFELSGVGHALEYGESRAVVPVGGGIPTNKYYYYPLHNRLDYKDASTLLRSLGYFSVPPSDGAREYKKNICHCPTCMEVIQDDINNFSLFENTEFYDITLHGVKQKRSYASQDTKEICVLHYQYNKHKEFLEVEKRSLNDFISRLEKTNSDYAPHEPELSKQIDYLSNWSSVLKSLVGLK
jgi:hypothetical protein